MLKIKKRAIQLADELIKTHLSRRDLVEYAYQKAYKDAVHECTRISNSYDGVDLDTSRNIANEISAILNNKV